jgi:hypothetical protein
MPLQKNHENKYGMTHEVADASDPAMQAGLTAAYDFLKSLPDFEGAQDV